MVADRSFPASDEAAMQHDRLKMSRDQLILELQRSDRNAEELAHVRHELEVHQEELRAQLAEMQQLQDQLQTSREEYIELYDLAPVGYLTFDIHSIVRAANLTACCLLDVERERILGVPLLNFVDASSRSEFHGHVRRCRTEKESVATELVLRTRSGRRIPVLIVSCGTAGAQYRTIIFDRTEQSQHDNSVRLLNYSLIAAQEDERRRISVELHDQMGQLLAGLILELHSIESMVANQPEVRKQLRQTQALAGQIGRQVHDLALDLRPSALDDLGLSAALLHYVETWSRRTSIKAAVHAELNGQRVPAAVEIMLYRVIQEALTNVARHSKATNVSVIVEWRDSLLIAIVEDNGCGFDSERVLKSGVSHQHLGLAGMCQRLAALGGTLEVESIKGKGTTVFARVPAPQLGGGSTPESNPAFAQAAGRGRASSYGATTHKSYHQSKSNR